MIYIFYLSKLEIYENKINEINVNIYKVNEININYSIYLFVIRKYY